LLRRLFATLVDMGIFGCASAGIFLPLLRRIDRTAALASYDAFVAQVTDPSVTYHAAGLLGIWVGMWWAYFVLGWGLCSATPGKWVAGLRITDHRGRCPINVSRALLRRAAYCVSSVTLGLGHLLIAVRRDHRALHDILAGTRVMRARDVAVARCARPGSVDPQPREDNETGSE
jgi:uncharacterized RDD family membrane protein YckC